MKKLLLSISLVTLFIQQNKAQTGYSLCFNSPSGYGSGNANNNANIATADFNGDSKPDLAWIYGMGGSSNQVAIVLNTGSAGIFSSSEIIITVTGASNINALCVGDFNGDNKPDIAVTDNVMMGSGNIYLLINTSTSSVTATFSVSSNLGVGNYPSSVCAADFNGDNKIDVAATNQNNNTVSVLLNTSTSTVSATFSPQSTFSVGTSVATTPMGICSGDFNGDGSPDIATANFNDNNVTILLNTTATGSLTATFNNAGNPGVGQFPEAIIAGDINNDGKGDLLVTSANGGNLTMLLSACTGTTTASFTNVYQASLSSAGRSCLADFNGDSKLDLAISQGLADASIYLNTSTTQTNIAFAGAVNFGSRSGNAICSADFNSDGRPDMAALAGGMNSSADVFIACCAPFTISVNSPSICTGATATLTASSAATSYSWSTGDTSATITATPTVTANYTVTGANAVTGCSSAAIDTVTVSPLPSITVSNATVCAGSSYTINPSGASTYTYMPAGPVVSPTVSTTYTVTGTDVNGCEGAATSSVIANALPTVTVNSATICAGDTTTLTANGATTYTWNTSAVTASISITPTVTTNYTVTGTDANGCNNVAISSVDVNALPTVTITVNTHTLCAGTTATLTASGASTYTWSTGPTTASVTETPTVTTSYTVTGTATDGCKNTSVTTLTVSNCVGIEQYTSINWNTVVYPNPNSGSFIIESDKELGEIEIYDMLGNRVYNNSSKQTQEQIDINALAKGLYILKVNRNSIRLVKTN